MPAAALVWIPLCFALAAGPCIVLLAERLPGRMGIDVKKPSRRRMAWATLLLLLLSMLVMRRYPNIVGVQGLVFTALLLLISLIDSETGLIPDLLVLLGVALAVVLRAFNFAPGGWPMAALGAAAGALPFYIIHRCAREDTLGLGDVKLMGMAGLYLGWPLIAFALLLGIVLGALVAVAMLLSGHKKREDTLPFGPMLCIGVWCAYMYGASLLRLYLQWLHI